MAKHRSKETPYFQSMMQRDETLGKYDRLTGLPGMTFFYDLAKEGKKHLIDSGTDPVLLFMDLNGMKFYNHKHGFAEGNRLLVSFSRILTEHFGEKCCSRFGQDHFAVFTSPENLEKKLSDFFDDCRSMNGDLSLPVRVGIYVNSMEDVDPSTACDRAKMACDQLRNTHVSGFQYFDKSMVERVEIQQYIIDHLEEALSEHWIKVYYQPIVRAVNGKVCEEEALARWEDPTRGLLSPDSFIPFLEEARLIYRLDLYILDRVIEKMLMQRQLGLHLVPTSINLSRSDFDSCDIVQEICNRIDQAELRRRLFTIEITESIIGSDFEYITSQIDRFKDLGFDVWIDDFGSGYSSLDVLQRVRFDLIKFDMRFMKEFGQGENDGAKGKIILSHLMRMAINLGVDTVCEGVETKEQVEFLREIGCTKLQGYYYHKPTPLEKLLDMREEGTGLGFENPAEASYYEAVGKVSLHDLSVMASDESNLLQNVFNTIPMGIMELTDNTMRFIRSNPAFRDCLQKYYHFRVTEHAVPISSLKEKSTHDLIGTLRSFTEEDARSFLDVTLPDRSTAHYYVRLLGQNPVTGTTATLIAILSITGSEEGANYTNIASALAANYSNLFYVSLENEDFIEYASDAKQELVTVARHGKKFFENSRKDAKTVLYSEDVPMFVEAFTRENVLHMLNTQGVFTLTYRQMIQGVPTYVTMKTMRMQDKTHLVIGVSNVDAQMKEKTKLERIRRDQLTYSRIMNLLGNFLCMYTVDVATDDYVEFNATDDYNSLGLEKLGEHFFDKALHLSKYNVALWDQEEFATRFTKENVLQTIHEKGIFSMDYHLIMDQKPVSVTLRATLVAESSGEKLIIGVLTHEQT